MNIPNVLGRVRSGLVISTVTAVLCVAPVAAQDTGAVTLEVVEDLYRAGDLAAAREGLFELAKSGDPVAQYRLGFMLANGEGGPFDQEGAIKWIEASLAQEYNEGHTILARVYLSGAPEVPHYERAAELLMVGVERGNAEAGMILGSLYRAGRGVESDPAKGFELILAAAKAGIPAAQFGAAQMYSRGEGVEQDAAQASRWLLTAAEAGHGEARLSLYQNYLRGSGFPKDEAKAMAWLVAAAEVGNTMAERILGTELLLAENAEDPEKGFALLMRAASKGEPGAQSNIGYAYATGTGVEQDIDQAGEWYQRAADQGLTRAALIVGDMYSAGEGRPQDIDAAFKYYRVADYGNSPVARVRLGELVLSGAIAEEEVSDLAYEWISATAESGSEEARKWLQNKSVMEPYAHYRLARIFSEGLGADVDATQGAKHYLLAAERGIVAAQEALSELYATGSGVDQDYIEAHKWANVAAANGIDAAAERRDVIAQLMTPEQLAEAQKRARTYMKTK